MLLPLWMTKASCALALAVAWLPIAAEGRPGEIHTTTQQRPVGLPAQPAVMERLTDLRKWQPIQIRAGGTRPPVDVWELAGGIPRGVRLSDIAELSRSWQREVAVFRPVGLKGRRGMRLVVGDAHSVAVPSDSKLILRTHLTRTPQQKMGIERSGQRSSVVLPVAL